VDSWDLSKKKATERKRLERIAGHYN
jgi:hypothetical protein